ncbi:ATP-binding cassette domain-containing protein [Paenibacillus sp. IB182496]|uniref:ATP-binding cassette domain-containing protein n=1 Tax=Paenibacillus sabuli TaxID=2772509 RepID=A0A927GSM2_9BACL|nr:ABC transporter transmembrane domain-containing protein [Paenibacillus sabuli]MBD2846899.1 ATP-binding cassette domain-containing protein [Paenibacillus sabuli]
MFVVLKKLNWYFAMQWKRYTIAVVLLLLTGIIDIIPPWLIGHMIDGIHQGTITPSRFMELMVFWGALIIGGYAIMYVWHYQLFGGAFVLERLMRSRLMRHFLRMTPTFYERNRTGDLMARSTNDLSAIAQTAGFGILTLVDSTLFMVTLLIVMAAAISWKLTLAALLPLPFIALAISRYGKRIHERFTDAQQAFGGLNDQVLEEVSGVRVTRAFVQERASMARFRATTDEVYGRNIAVARIEALFEPTIKVLVGASYLIGLGFGAYLVFRGEITLGELVSFNVFLGMLIWPMFAIGELINIMQRGNASLDRVLATLGEQPDITDAPAPRQDAEPGDIAFERWTFRYPSAATDNLRALTFALQRGQTLGIVGRTGSGKTTLLRQLLREYPGGSGSVTIGGVPLADIPLERLLGWIGYVPQQPVLFSRSVRDNVRFGRPEASEAELEEALRRAALLRDIAQLPDGLETMVGERGVALSGGQKQRVSIARALIAQPEVLLLDDALSAVDAKTEAQIVDGIREARAGKTTLITTHRLSAVQHADLILVLEDGAIVERGTHAELLELGGWYKKQYDRQQLESQLDEDGEQAR